MPDIYEDFTAEETTSKALDENRLVNFAYDDTAFDDNITKWKGYYDYNAHNNIQAAPVLPDETLENGFGRTSGVFKRTFTNHYLGRISYNLNKTIQALRSILGSFRSDYSENISEYSEAVKYRIGDVCFRLNDDEIIFYRCIANTSGGAFDGRFWTKPEEVLSHDRPAVGVPVMWYEKVPDWAIRFDDNGHHYWVDCPALNFDDFRALVVVDENDEGFTVPDFRNKVPMFTGGDNEVHTGYNGGNYAACLQAHGHVSKTLTFTIPAETYSHTHTGASCGGSGNHQHELLNRCNYKRGSNRSQLPVDDISRYNPATLTEYAGSHGHTGSTSSSGVDGHIHTVTVTGYTGPIKETEGGNPDSFQGCWIVRYK